MSGAPSDFLQIARVLKSYGTEGELLMGFREIDPEDLDLKEPVFIMFDGLPVPFFIEHLSTRGVSKALVRLVGIKCLADAEEVAGCEVYARRSCLGHILDEEEGLSADMLTGWTLLDEDGSEVGTITGCEPIPGNPCLYVETSDGRTVMVPLHDDLVVEVDEEGRKIGLRIPEGLI